MSWINAEPGALISHDLPYRLCVACGVPIPAADLVDDEYQPRHRTCVDHPAREGGLCLRVMEPRAEVQPEVLSKVRCEVSR